MGRLRILTASWKRWGRNNILMDVDIVFTVTSRPGLALQKAISPTLPLKRISVEKELRAFDEASSGDPVGPHSREDV
jgi:hypothetical protein